MVCKEVMDAPVIIALAAFLLRLCEVLLPLFKKIPVYHVV
jgi:hypothetical protein